MTPLAHRFVKELMLPVRKQDQFVRDNAGLLRTALSDIHCFEVTKVVPLLPEVKEAWKNSDQMNTLLFLPAPKTFLEFLHPSGIRLGFLAEEGPGSKAANMTSFFDDKETGLFCQHAGVIALGTDDFFYSGEKQWYPTRLVQGSGFRLGDTQFVHGLLALMHLFLIMINSPKIIGRKQHMPHRSLEKNALKAFGPGKFPLHAWTDIKLQVSKPPEIDDGEPHEAHLTGRRALHFVRKHIRVRLGRLEWVSAHWRGDAALGIKRSRYTVEQ